MTGTALVEINGNRWNVEVATTTSELINGLSGRALLAAGTGMLFVLPVRQLVTVQTAQMLFPIDIIFIKDETVLSIASNILPGYLVEEATPIDMFLEVNSGEAALVEVGDIVSTVSIQQPTPGFDFSSIIAFGIPLAILAFVSGMFGKGSSKKELKSGHHSNVTVTCPICGDVIEIPEYDSVTRSDALGKHISKKHGMEHYPSSIHGNTPLNWYEKLFTETIDGQEFYRVKNYYPVGWPDNPRIEMSESSIAKDTYRDWQRRAKPFTFEQWKVEVWKEAGKPLSEKRFILWDMQMKSSLGSFKTRNEAKKYADEYLVKGWRDWIEIKEEEQHVTGHSIHGEPRRRLVDKYGSWAVGRAEAVCPEGDVKCVTREAERLFKTIQTRYGEEAMEYYMILSPGQTVFHIGDVVSQVALEKENKRVRELGEREATYQVAKPKTIPIRREPTRETPTEIEFFPDSPEFLAYTIKDIGYAEKLESAFKDRILKVRSD